MYFTADRVEKIAYDKIVVINGEITRAMKRFPNGVFGRSE
jgi:hypothetical protein